MRTESEIMASWNGSTVPLVSIACPTYNHVPYIRHALDGFLAQETDFPIEVVIHDDASTDGTAQIVRDYQERYPNIVRPIFRTENQFAKKGRTATTDCVAICRGRYVALCEGDDYWTDSGKLSLQADFLERNPEYSMHTHAVDVRDDTVNGVSYDPYHPITKSFNTFQDILAAHFIPTLSLMFRKSFWPTPMPAFVFDCRSRDIAYELLLAARGPCFYLDRKMGVYRHHDGGITKTQYGPLKDREFLLTLYRGLQAHLGKRYARPIERKIAWLDYVTGRAISREPGMRRQELALYWDAITADPLVPWRVRAMNRALARARQNGA